MTDGSLAVEPPVAVTNNRASLIGLLFVVILLLALITLPPLTSSRAEALRSYLDNDIQNFLDALTGTENVMQDMQAAARGYVLTREAVFLEEYRTAQDALPARLEALQSLAPTISPTMAGQISDLLEVVQRWQREGGDRNIALVQQGEADVATRTIASGRTQAIFSSFRQRVDEIQQQTQAIRADVQMQITRARTLQISITTGLGALGLVAAGFVVMNFRNMVRLMHDLQAARERSATLAATARAERQRLQAVFDHSPEGMIFASAPDGVVQLANPAARSLLGEIDGATLPAQSWTTRVFRPGGERYAVDDVPLVRSLHHGEACQSVELTIEQADGQRVPVLFTSVPLRGEDGHGRGAVAVFQDLRRLREVERLKSDFVALVSHELRTPLTAIQGCVQTLLNSGDVAAKRTREFLHIIDEQSERLQELIDNLLSLSQVEAGALRLRRELVQPQPLIAGVLRQLRERLADLDVQAEIAQRLPGVSADGRRIEQVLFNLVDNARKFSPPHGRITVRAEVQDAHVVVSVRDHGPGVPPNERERIFERFYQVEQPTTRGVGGSGLGLAICKAIIEAHGGRIWVEDAPGGGALFSFTLPAVPAETRQELPAQLIQRSHDRTHVLVVDDDPTLRRLLETSLPDKGYSVQAVVEAQAALAAVTEQPPDVILLDVMLPGTDGFALCQRLREWTNVPIIMLTARAAEKDVVLGLQLGADDYLTKPFRANELTARIEAVLRRSRVDVPGDSATHLMIGELDIDLASRQVSMSGALVELTPTEYHILVFLARHPGQVLTHRQILEAVWGKEYSDENHYLWVHIAHLRQKLEPNSKEPRYIITERGVGYRMARAPQTRNM